MLVLFTTKIFFCRDYHLYMISEMSTTDSGINVTTSTEFFTDTEVFSDIREDTPSPLQVNGSEQSKDDMMDSKSVYCHMKTKDATTNSTANHFASLSGESSIGITEVQVTKVLKFRLVITSLVIICLVVMVYLIPVILYYTDTPGEDSDSGGYDYETCSVSFRLFKVIPTP